MATLLIGRPSDLHIFVDIVHSYMVSIYKLFKVAIFSGFGQFEVITKF